MTWHVSSRLTNIQWRFVKVKMKKCQIIGALCYGSLFIYRDGLLRSIQDEPAWIALNSAREKPIIIDLVVKPFKIPRKSVEMIFVRAKRSKKEEARNFFLHLYDGTPKKYPRGDMLLFIPLTSKLEADYTDAQRAKFVFNHSTYIGNQDCTAIFGLADLNTEVSLNDGSIITLRTLLKSLPASPGMVRNRLFQVVDPNAAQDCVLVTFQRCDRPFIEDRKFELEKEILSHLEPGQASSVFLDEFEGISFVGAFHKKKGKVIRIHQPTKEHQDFVRHANNSLSSPPKKRPHPSETPVRHPITPLQPIQVTNVTYSGAVQAQTTRTRSVEVQPNGTRTTTTTQMSQTSVMAIMETRFHSIENEQQDMKERITGVEHRTIDMCDNIQTMMAHWKITPASYKRKLDENDHVVSAHAHRFDTTDQGQGDTHF